MTVSSFILMAKKSKKGKKPKSIDITSQKQPKKSPEIEPTLLWQKKASWSISSIDTEGDFGWHKVDLNTFHYIQSKLSGFETRTWREIFLDSSSNNHGCLVKELSQPARKRLEELNLDDYEKLHSLRLDGKKRVWGIFEDGYFRVLWWDPEHQVYLSRLKNT